jgi:hypothetical protein
MKRKVIEYYKEINKCVKTINKKIKNKNKDCYADIIYI